MELRQLKYFVAVAEEMQFSKAAHRLLVSQPALSQQINLLETELGIDLFVKAKRKVYRKVELTEAGKIFFKDAQHILTLCEKAKETIVHIKSTQKTIKLGTYRMLTGQRILDTLALFNQHFPEYDIKIIEYPTHLSVEEALMDAAIDFGIAVMPLHFKNLDSILLKKSYLNVILSKNHPFALRETLSLSDLKDEKWIEIEATMHPIFEEVEKLCAKAGFNRRQHIVQEVSSLDVMAQLVGMGKGIAFVPSFYDTANIPNIVNKPLANTYIPFEQCLAFRKDKHNKMGELLNKLTIN
jgi:DNA-binding transcriptional LysR family regulator